MSSPDTKTLKALFARSGNACAFPGCDHPLVEDSGLVVAQVAHIVGVKGPRHVEDWSEGQIHGLDNLMVLCFRHHRAIDSDPEAFPVSRLRRMKAEHERMAGYRAGLLTDAEALEVQAEIDAFWVMLHIRKEREHPVPDLAVEIDSEGDARAHLARIRQSCGFLRRFRDDLLSSISTIADDVEESLAGRNFDDLTYMERKELGLSLTVRAWDVLYMGMANQITEVEVATTQLEIEHYQVLRRFLPGDPSVAEHLRDAQQRLVHFATSWGYVD